MKLRPFIRETTILANLEEKTHKGRFCGAYHELTSSKFETHVTITSSRGGKHVAGGRTFPLCKQASLHNVSISVTRFHTHGGTSFVERGPGSRCAKGERCCGEQGHGNKCLFQNLIYSVCAAILGDR